MQAEQSNKRAAIYEKLALKDKLEANKQRQSLIVLTEELEKHEQITEQLETLIAENLKDNSAKTAMALHSASWFSTKVRDQLELVKNRCAHLKIEIDEMRRKLAHAERRRTRKTEKAEELYKQARQDKQNRQDAALSERGRSRSPIS